MNPKLAIFLFVIFVVVALFLNYYLNNQITFQNVTPSPLNLQDLEDATKLSFQLKDEFGGKFDNITVQPIVEKSSGSYVKTQNYTYDDFISAFSSSLRFSS